MGTLLERLLDARIRRIVEGDFGRTARVQEGERNVRRDVCPETDGREDTGGTEQYGPGVNRFGESLCTQRHGDGDAAVDGSTRSGSEDG